ncbi:MAG: tripartite tricarboxylate transporter substrate binding protein [Betaproteobacteria bacterium]|nr:tripartite tricarboxylate transporter substrate binding protein [Betaproteobacteria bacterium]
MHMVLAAVVGTLLAATAHAAETTYPDKPIRLVIGSAAGSGPDLISRVLAERLFKSWGQRVIVDSRPGAAGILSAEFTLRAPADGYTWMMLTSQLLVATAVFPNVKFNLEKDFASVSLIGTVPFVLVANPQVPAQTLQELIALAKKSPGALRYGSAGSGSSEHLCGVMLTSLTGTEMLHVPYKGVPQAITDTIAKEVELTYAVVTAVQPMIQAGRVRALGVTSRNRAALLPTVPSIAEVVPGYEMFGWYSIVAPTGTPPAILAKISAELVKAVKEPEFGDQLKNLGIDIVGGTREELDAFRRTQTRQISELAKTSGVDVKQ